MMAIAVTIMALRRMRNSCQLPVVSCQRNLPRKYPGAKARMFLTPNLTAEVVPFPFGRLAARLKSAHENFRRPYGTHRSVSLLPGAERAGLLSVAPLGRSRT